MGTEINLYGAIQHLNLEKVLFLARGVALSKHPKEVLASEPSTLTIPVKQVKA